MYFLKLIAIREDFIHELQLFIEEDLTYAALSSLSQVDWREAT